MASHRYWRLNVIENYGNFYAGKGAVATIDLRVSSGGSNLATTGNGTASASTEVSGFEASKAFDGDVNTYWQSGDAATANSQWIKWDFGAGNEQDINYVALTNGNEAAGSQLIKRWALYYSDDNSNWTPWMYSTSNNSSASNDTPTAWSWSSSMVPSGTLSLTLTMLTLTSRTGGSALLSVPLLTLEATGNYSLDATLPMLTLESRSGSIVAMTLPMLSLLATGHDRANALDADLPMFTLEAQGGAALDLTLPALTLTASGTVVNLGTLAQPLPMLTFDGSATITQLGRLSSTLPAMLLAAAGGAAGAPMLPRLTLAGSGTVGSVASLSAVLPVFELDASGDIENFGGLDASLPALMMVPSGRADMALPGFTLTAIGHAVVTVTYDAYATNLQPGEGMPHQVTQYTNFPFNQIVRWGDSYYGVADDGLYLLGGDTDYASPTATAIPWRMQTALTNFGSRQKKAVRQSFIHGRLGPSVTAKVAVGEGTEQSYAALIERGSGAQAHRIKYGRGLKGEFWRFELADTAGSQFDLDGWEHDPAESERRI